MYFFLSQNQLFFGNERLEYQNTTTICGVKVSLNYYCGKNGKQRIFRKKFDILCEVSERNANRRPYTMLFISIFEVYFKSYDLMRKMISFIFCN